MQLVRLLQVKLYYLKCNYINLHKSCKFLHIVIISKDK